MDVGFDVGGLADVAAVGLPVVGIDDAIVVGLRVEGLDVGFRVVGALNIGDFSPPPQMQHAMFAISPARAKLFPYKEHLVAPFSLPAYHMQSK